jgi:peptidoglycan/LPS O-acetylase OafA/YrhL
VLDALRGIAAIVVVFFHVPPMYRNGVNFPNSFLAVDFFFCLSGFVVAYAYEDRLMSTLSLRDYLAARFIRLYPLYALGTLAAIARSLVSSHFVHQVHSRSGIATLIALALAVIPNFMVTAAGPAIFPFNFPSWSLFFEGVANLAYGVVLVRRIARLALPLLCLGSLVILTMVVLQSGTLDFGAARDGFSIGFARVAFSFLAGVLLFRLFRLHAASALPLWMTRLAAGAAVVLVPALLLLSTRWSQTGLFQLLTVALLFPALVYLGAHATLPASLNAACVLLGTMSYPLYMLHVPLMLPFESPSASRIFTQHASVLPYFVPAFIACLVLISWIVGRSIDPPVRSWLTKHYKS